jgi:hypothetical protein
MIDFESSDKLPCEVGDEFMVLSDIRRDDIIVIEPNDPRNFVIRALREYEFVEHEGPKYRVDNGREQGTIILSSYYNKVGIGAE